MIWCAEMFPTCLSITLHAKRWSLPPLTCCKRITNVLTSAGAGCRDGIGARNVVEGFPNISSNAVNAGLWLAIAAGEIGCEQVDRVGRSWCHGADNRDLRAESPHRGKSELIDWAEWSNHSQAFGHRLSACMYSLLRAAYRPSENGAQ
jgi:hypothetical protein